MNNRMWNARNPYQGKFTRILCVCSAGLLRSPTLAWVLSQEPYACNTRACGVDSDHALISLDDVLLNWADVTMYVNNNVFKTALRLFPDIDKFKYEVLDIPDIYEYRDPKLVEIIKQQLKDRGY